MGGGEGLNTGLTVHPQKEAADSCCSSADPQKFSLAQKNWFAKVKSARLRRDSRGQTSHHGRKRKITQGEEPKLNAPALEPAQSTVGESD